MKRVLISGASIAGPALAYWLQRNGFEVQLVERAAALRSGGQAIDIRGIALEVMSRMGLLGAARAHRTRMMGMSVLDKQGTDIWRSTERTLSGGRLDSGDVELLKDDLTRLLYDASSANAQYCFGDSITKIIETRQGVDVFFERGAPQSFDLVIGADGFHSNVRTLLDETPLVRDLGSHIAIFSAENFLGLDNWQLSFRDEVSGYLVYPVRDNTELRVTLGFGSSPSDPVLDVQAQKALVAQRCSEMGGPVPRLLAAMWHAPDFYFGSMAQIHLSHWSAGRIALLGDAAYCPSPLSGQGTSLALVGAYVLADELTRTSDDHIAAFSRYAERMRPYVRANQALAIEYPRGGIPDEVMERAKMAIPLDAEAAVDPPRVKRERRVAGHK